MKKYHSQSVRGLLSGLALVAASIVSAPANCVLDSSFNTADYLNPGAIVSAVAIQSDGKVICGGYFSYTYYMYTFNNLVRFNTDGTPDLSFNPSPNAPVRAILVQPDQKIVIGGHFTQVYGYNIPYLSRLSTNGFPEGGFPLSPPNNAVYALGRFSDGRILIGGAFTTMGGFSYQHLACLKSTGGLVASFNPGVYGNAVWAIAIYPPGVPSADKTMIGGDFTLVGSYSRINIARLDFFGSVDTTFDMGGSVLNAPVYALATDYGPFTTQGPGGPSIEKVYIGGAFTTPRNYFTRLAHAGYPDSNIEGAVTDGTVNSIRIQANHGVLLGGAFTHAPWQVRNRVARFYAGGAEDGSNINDLLNLSTWSDCDPNGANGAGNAIALSASGQVYIGGAFTQFEGVAREAVARLFPNP